MLQIVTQFCLLHLIPSHAGGKYFFSAVKSMQKILADDTFCACIATAVDFSIQVQMNQWKIVWLPVWIKCDILSGVVLYLIRV